MYERNYFPLASMLCGRKSNNKGIANDSFTDDS